MWRESFLNYLKLERNYSVLTVNSYRIDLEQFEIYLKGIGRGIDDITVDGDIVRNWIVFQAIWGRYHR